MNILDQAGNTPLLKLDKVNPNPDVKIYVKCESLNPSDNVKDRMALSIIEGPEQSGRTPAPFLLTDLVALLAIARGKAEPNFEYKW